jgi:hypothetical protein
VREKSHLDDMRAAIRGDFERLAQRLGTQELMQEPAANPEGPHGPEERPDQPVQTEAREELVEEAKPEAPVAEAPEASMPEAEEPPAEEAPRRSLLARILGL